MNSSKLPKDHAKEVKRKFLFFLKNEKQDSLTLESHELPSLPNIFHLPEFKRLKTLNLRKNQLKSLPNTLGNLTQLTNLYLFSNRLANLPKEIGKLTSLINLELTNNELTSLPPEIGELTSLTTFEITNNQLKHLPSEIGKLTALIYFYLSNNKLVDLPTQIEFLVALKRLVLSQNRLTTLPTQIEKLTQLIDLDLNNNTINKLPCEIGSLNGLNQLRLRENRLTSLPSEILDLQKYCSVNIENNLFSEETLTRLQEAASQDGYQGPSFQLSVARAGPQYTPKLKEESLQSLYKAASKPYKPLKMKEESEKLADWLSRLNYISDYNASPEIKKAFALNVIGYLELAEKNEEYCNVFNVTIQDATRTCGDRMALSVLDLGVAKSFATIDKSDLKSLATLLKTVVALRLLEDCAEKKLKKIRFADRIEVYLTYPVKLKDKLKLQIDINEIRFFQMSDVTDQDLIEAGKKVSKEINDPNAFYKHLIENHYWTDALQQKYPEEYKKAEELKFNTDPTDSNYYIGKENEGFITLTKNVLE